MMAAIIVLATSILHASPFPYIDQFGNRITAAPLDNPPTQSSFASRSHVIMPRTSPALYDQIVVVESVANQVDPNLIRAIIWVESLWDPDAHSSKGACGLMQLMPSTARRFGVHNIWSPHQNIAGGAKYIRYLLHLFRGNPCLAVAAYNAGESAVQEYGGIPPFPETQHYVRNVALFYRALVKRD